MDDIGALILIIFAMVVTFWLYVLLPWGMAERRNRSVFIWLLISLVFSPFLAIVLLYLLGDADG